MNSEKFEIVKSYYQTDDQTWNVYALETIKIALSEQLFEDMENLMKLYKGTLSIATETHKNCPLEAIQAISSEYEARSLQLDQKAFLLERVCVYLKNAKIDGWNSKDFVRLALSQKKAYLKELKQNATHFHYIPTVSIKDMLEYVVRNELRRLPTLVNYLETEQRLNLLCKLLPYVISKNESITHTIEKTEPEDNEGWAS